jgi:hypothetical protein
MQACFGPHKPMFSHESSPLLLNTARVPVAATASLGQSRGCAAPSGAAGLRSGWGALVQRAIWGALAALLGAAGLHAEGIPEPGLVIYGVVWNVQGGVTNRLTSGSLTCQITPSNAASITLVTPLQNINDQYSYLLKVPFESRILGLSLSAGALELTTATNRFERLFKINGTNASFAAPAQEVFAFAPADRARQERVDLFVGLGAADSNQNGIPDWWEVEYFGGLIDANADGDGDGLTSLEEYIAGTNPTNRLSAFKFISVRQDSEPGLVLEWSSASNRVYSVLRATELLGAYTIIRSNIPATPPSNSFRDTNTLYMESGFYRVRIQ